MQGNTLALAVGMFLGLLIGFVIATVVITENWRERTITADCAHYDPVNGWFILNGEER